VPLLQNKRDGGIRRFTKRTGQARYRLQNKVFRGRRLFLQNEPNSALAGKSEANSEAPGFYKTSRFYKTNWGTDGTKVARRSRVRGVTGWMDGTSAR
jgi:hypothetical protein